MLSRPLIAAAGVLAMAASLAGSARAQVQRHEVALSTNPIPPSYTVEEVRDGGRYIVAGGMLWEVMPRDRPIAVAWKPGASVVVRRIWAPTNDWEFALTNNAERNQAVATRFAGRPAAAPDGGSGGGSAEGGASPAHVGHRD